jgi:hypothetical protein
MVPSVSAKQASLRIATDNVAYCYGYCSIGVRHVSYCDVTYCAAATAL